MTTNSDKSLILNRIKFAKKLHSELELALFLGVSASILSNWRKRNSINYDTIFEKCEDMDINWLINGTENIDRIGNIIAEEPKAKYSNKQDCKDCKIKEAIIKEKERHIITLEKLTNSQDDLIEALKSKKKTK